MSLSQSKKLHIFITLLLCIPLLTTTYLPLVDYPSHLARMHILAHYRDVASFRQHYRILIQPIPNLAMDLVIPFIAGIFGTIAAGKLFLLAFFGLYSLSCYLLAVSIFGYATRATLLPLFFVYNSTFFMGFINYGVGIAVFLLAYAYWLRWRHGWTVARFVGFSVLASACYLAHLSSIAILAVATGTVMLWDVQNKHTNRWLTPMLTAAATLPVLWAYLSFMHGSGSVGLIQWNTIPGKLIGLLGVIRSYSVYVDILFLLSLAFSLLYLFWVKAEIRINPVALWPAVSLLLAYSICPLILYTSASADTRFVWPACVLLALSFRIRNYSFILPLLIAISIIRLGSIWWDWHQEDRVIATIVHSFDRLPRYASLYPAFYNIGDLDTVKRNHALLHTASYAVITRDAFVPTVFAEKGQQPLIMRPEYSYHVWTEQGNVVRGYKYLWAYEPPRELQKWLKKDKLLSSEGPSSLWQLQN